MIKQLMFLLQNKKYMFDGYTFYTLSLRFETPYIF